MTLTRVEKNALFRSAFTWHDRPTRGVRVNGLAGACQRVLAASEEIHLVIGPQTMSWQPGGSRYAECWLHR